MIELKKRDDILHSTIKVINPDIGRNEVSNETWELLKKFPQSFTPDSYRDSKTNKGKKKGE